MVLGHVLHARVKVFGTGMPPNIKETKTGNVTNVLDAPPVMEKVSYQMNM